MEQKRRLNWSPQGFTVLEMAVATSLTALLALLIANCWSAIGRSVGDVVARSQIVQEVNLAIAALAADWSGYLPESASGDLRSGRLVGRMIVDHKALRLCFESNSSPDDVANWSAPDTVIVYELDDGRLIRSNLQAQTDHIVAIHLEQMEINDTGNEIEITLKFRRRKIERLIRLVLKNA